MPFSPVSEGLALEDLVLAANYMLGPVDYSKWDNATTLFMHRKALAFSGGGCLSVLSQRGFLHVLNHVTPPDLWNGSLPLGISFLTATSGGSWSSQMYLQEPMAPLGFQQCDLSALTVDAHQTPARMLDCVGCTGLTYEECNAKERSTVEVENLFGIIASCVHDGKGTAKEAVLKKSAELQSAFCSAWKCSMENVYDALLEDIFHHAGGVSAINISKATVIVAGTAYDNTYGLPQDIPWRTPQGWTLNNHASQPDKIKSILAGATDAISEGVITCINLIESLTCKNLPGQKSRNEVSARIMNQLFAFYKHDAKTFRLLQDRMQHALAGHKQSPGVLKSLSPVKSVIWPFLVHDSVWGPALTDAGTSDGTSVFHTIQAMDKMDEADRLESVLVFDTTPHGALSGYKPEVKVRTLFAKFVSTLEGLGLNCRAADEMVPNPNHVYTYKTKNDTLIGIFDAFSELNNFNKNFTRRKTEFEVRVPGGPIP